MARKAARVDAFVPLAQNYSIISADSKAGKVELPFIFYAVNPAAYARTFSNVKMVDGDFIASGTSGIIVSSFQNDEYQKKYGVRLAVGQEVTVLGLSDGGGVNAYKTYVRGIFDALYYKNVFNYINFMDIGTYSSVYNFTGVTQGSLSPTLEKKLDATSQGEDSIFSLAGDSSGTIDTTKLKSETVSGYTMIAVRVKDHATASSIMARVLTQAFEVKAARWDEASGFFARISSALQAFIYLATALIFLGWHSYS